MGALLLSGVSQAPLNFANASATVVQSFGGFNTSSGTTLTATATQATTAGDLLVATIRTRGLSGTSTVSSVTDSAGAGRNQWTKATATGGTNDGEIWYAANTVSDTTVTVTVTSSAALSMTVLEVAGAALTSPLDKTALASGTGTAASVGPTATLSQASEIVIGDIGFNGAVTLSGQTSGYSTTPLEQSTASSNNSGEQAAFEILTTLGTPPSYGATLNSSKAWTGTIATFKTGAPTTTTITGFSPPSGPVGTVVTVTGAGFTGATVVKFNTTTATTFSVTDDGHLNATVPTGATTGTISVTAPGGTATSSTSFTVTTSPVPTITSFSPSSGPISTPVAIVGTGFTGASAVKFNGTTATYSITDDAHISTSVPAGAVSGTITVTTPGGTATSSTSFTVTTPPTAPHIMLIVEENHSYSGTGGVIGNSQAPYINSLAQTYLSSTSWYSPYHGSPLDYTSLIAGNTDGSITKPSSDTTFVDELTSAGLSWGAYFEAMPFSCDTANWPTGSNSSNALYALDHNPFTYYSSTRTTAACQNNVPVAAPSTIPAGPNDPFATLMSSNSLPDFMFVVPDNCDEMHSECPANGNNEPSNGDAWLKYNMPAIQASNWYKQGGVVIITWDEAYHTDDSAWVNGAVCPSTPTAPFCGGSPVATGGKIPNIVVSAATAALSNHNNSCGGNLFGILRGIEETYGVGLLSNSANTGNGDLGPEINSPNTGCITGTVTDGTATGHPVLAGVTVACTCQTGAVTTNSAGNYVFSGVSPGSYSLTFTNTGDVTQSIPSVTVTTGNTTQENAALIEDGSITGQVTDSVTHAAIANATVTCTCQTGSVLTNSTGNYTYTNVAPGTSYTMTFSATGHATMTINNVTVLAGQTTTENAALGPALGGISGTVTDGTTSGHPVLPGVTVACTCSGTNAITNSSGVYSFSNIATGSYSLTFSNQGFVTQTISPVVVGSGTTNQNAALTKDGTINGTVTDSITHAAISGATVACSGTPTCAGTATAVDGTYTLTVDPGTYAMTVTATGYAMGSRSSVVVTAGTATPESFSLVPNQGTIGGTVTDSLTHAPISGASVACTGTSTCTSTTTAADGSYTLNVTEGTYDVTASDTGAYSPQTFTSITVGPGGTQSQNFALGPLSGTISGTVYQSDGTTPISAATVACTGTLTCSPATTDGSGTYALSGLSEGTYQITASATGFAPETLTVAVGPGGNVTGQNFQLAAGPGTITGTVTDTVTSIAISGASVTCLGPPACTGTTTAGDGTYTLTVAPGTYTVQLSDTGYKTTSTGSLVVTTGTPTPGPSSMTPNPSTISGQVTDSFTSAPISGATVACTGTTTCISTTTAPDGTYVLNVTEGTYDVTASDTGPYSPKTFTAINVGPGGTPTQNFALAPVPGTISGTVTAALGGAGINGATVACTGSPTCTSTLTSDNAGDYQLTGLAEGTYHITASFTGYTPQTLQVVVGPGATVTGQNFQLSVATAPLGVAKSFGAGMGTTGSNTLTATLTSGSTGAGDLLVVVVRSRTATAFTPVSGITDSSGTNTWTAPPAALKSQKVQADEEIWYLPNAASVTSVTVTMSGTTSVAMTVLDVTGTSATPLDKTSSTFNTSTAATTGSTPLTTQANEIVVGAIGWNGAESAGFPNAFTSGFTTSGTGLQEVSNVSGFIAGEQTAWEILSSTGTPSFGGTLSGSVAWTGVIATFH